MSEKTEKTPVHSILSNPHPVRIFIKFCLFILFAIIVIHLESLTRSAIFGFYNWCGTPQLARKSVADIYTVIIAPMAMVFLFINRKNRSIPDSLVRISGLVLWLMLFVYWFFESICPLNWFAAKWSDLF